MLIGESEEHRLAQSAWCMDSFNCVVRHSRTASFISEDEMLPKGGKLFSYLLTALYDRLGYFAGDGETAEPRLAPGKFIPGGATAQSTEESIDSRAFVLSHTAPPLVANTASLILRGFSRWSILSIHGYRWWVVG